MKWEKALISSWLVLMISRVRPDQTRQGAAGGTETQSDTHTPHSTASVSWDTRRRRERSAVEQGSTRDFLEWSKEVLETTRVLPWVEWVSNNTITMMRWQRKKHWWNNGKHATPHSSVSLSQSVWLWVSRVSWSCRQFQLSFTSSSSSVAVSSRAYLWKGISLHSTETRFSVYLNLWFLAVLNNDDAAVYQSNNNKTIYLSLFVIVCFQCSEPQLDMFRLRAVSVFSTSLFDLWLFACNHRQTCGGR